MLQVIKAQNVYSINLAIQFIAFYAYLVTCIIPNRIITFAPAPSPIPIQYLIRSWSRTVIKSSPRACKLHERNQRRIENFYLQTYKRLKSRRDSFNLAVKVPAQQGMVYHPPYPQHHLLAPAGRHAQRLLVYGCRQRSDLQ